MDLCTRPHRRTCMSQAAMSRKGSGAEAFLGPSTQPATLFTYLCLGQGLYYFVTGVWPLLSIETFQLVTGRKTDHLVTGREADHWLVMTVGVLVIAIGTTCVFAALRRGFAVEVAVLAITSAIGLTCIDSSITPAARFLLFIWLMRHWKWRL